MLVAAHISRFHDFRIPFIVDLEQVRRDPYAGRGGNTKRSIDFHSEFRHGSQGPDYVTRPPDAARHFSDEGWNDARKYRFPAMSPRPERHPAPGSKAASW